jgi:flagellar motor protein MotB
MAEDWALDVKKYVPDADDGVIAAIVRYCGIALRSRDASLVSFTDSVETDRVRENYCKKKLGLTEPDSVLDAAIAAVGERMSGDSTRNRVTVYYLLADHFGKLGLFGAGSADAAPMPLMAAAEEKQRGVAATGWGDYLPLAVLVIGGLGILSMLGRKDVPAAPVAVAAPATVVVAIPVGVGITTSVVDGEPMVSVYFDTAKFEIDPSFAERTKDVRDYLAAHPGEHLQVSGYNDPRGDAAMNAELSKNRAFAVRDALVALGVSITSIDLVKPAETTDTDTDYTNARRVDITVEDGPVAATEAPAAEVAPAAAAPTP